uniref:VWFA domain-containing protein n=1 Tax=Biomphalaria glabrata TaxID=6526 RepID=A0A2C9LR74_BIOGL
MTLFYLAICACIALLCSDVSCQNTCPPMELNFILDQSENARYAASEDPQNPNSKFDILENQMRTILSYQPLNSPVVKVAVYGYSGYDSKEIVPEMTSATDAAYNSIYLSKLRSLTNSGSWTYNGLKTIVRRPYSPNAGVVILVSSQGSSSVTRRNLSRQEAIRVRGLGWRIFVIEVVVIYLEIPRNIKIHQEIPN